MDAIGEEKAFPLYLQGFLEKLEVDWAFDNIRKVYILVFDSEIILVFLLP